MRSCCKAGINVRLGRGLKGVQILDIVVDTEGKDDDCSANDYFNVFMNCFVVFYVIFYDILVI